ncbi:RHS repeat-associated core domain-containing protein [uncultured Paludibaculum sp.]|uniref:RHS repeat-associated core domain-containing protein n=1 Tax=uncultured Paludibaculum sp. TaxID=1765020 RepID=UPI002AABA7B4|nr:RHS repeat-associated core domain-containing protein [uncultured Paludibaculum sp.]
MTTIQTPDTAESYKYGPGNLRAIKQMPYDTWYSVYGKDGELLGTYKECTGGGGIAFLCEARERVYFGRRLVQFEGEPSSWQGVTPNQVGSPLYVHGRVYPYGETENGLLWADQEETFATYKRDQFAGLDYAMNRHYSSAWGRFTTADPYRASGGPADPQSWNRYAYVENDPVNFNDRRGLLAEAAYGTCPAWLTGEECGVSFGDGYTRGGLGGTCVAGTLGFASTGAPVLCYEREWNGAEELAPSPKKHRTYFLAVEGLGDNPADCYRVPTSKGGVVTREITYRLKFMEEGMPSPMGYPAVIWEHVSGSVPTTGEDSPSSAPPGIFIDTHSILAGASIQNVTQSFTAMINGVSVGVPVMSAFGGDWSELTIEKHAGYVSVNGNIGGKLDSNGKLIPGTYTPCQ